MSNEECVMSNKNFNTFILTHILFYFNLSVKLSIKLSISSP